MKELKVTLKTLVPIWTGEVDSACDRLHEIEIIAGFRGMSNSSVVGDWQHARMVGAPSR